MIVRIDARRLADEAGLHAALAEALGLPPFYGRNLDALADCLTCLDNTAAGMSRVQVFAGHLLLLVIDHADAPGPHADQIRTLSDVVAFVNWRRLEKGDPPVVALAYAPG